VANRLFQAQNNNAAPVQTALLWREVAIWDNVFNLVGVIDDGKVKAPILVDAGLP
jgi:hypothetical protein